MKTYFLLFVLMTFSLLSCNENKHAHEAEDVHGHAPEHEETSGQQHVHEEAEAPDDHAHEEQAAHEEPVFQYTAYSDEWEVFAESDAFVVGEPANVLAHFSVLPGFEPLDSAKVTATLRVGGTESVQVLNTPTRKGIFRFSIQPKTAGQGSLLFEINNGNDTSEVLIPSVTVYDDHHEAHEADETLHRATTNTTVFTKEQSWKIDFATQLPEVMPFGQVIKAAALVKPAIGNENMVVSKTSGVVSITSGSILEGKEVKAGEALFYISGKNLAQDNLSVRFAEARNNYEQTLSDYERMQELAKDKIVSQRELLEARKEYRNARALYENLKENFDASGQSVVSPMNGFIKHVFVQNGAYVQAGQPVVSVSQDNRLLLTANVVPKYAPVLGTVVSANVRNSITNRTFSLEQLNGKMLTYGKAADNDNFLLPVSLEIDNEKEFLAGSFVEVYLKAFSDSTALTVPSSSLLEEQGNFFVWVQITPELFEKRQVVPGATDGLRTEITAGLSPEERIVSRGAMMIKLSQATGTLDAHSGHVH